MVPYACLSHGSQFIKSAPGLMVIKSLPLVRARSEKSYWLTESSPHPQSEKFKCMPEAPLPSDCTSTCVKEGRFHVSHAEMNGPEAPSVAVMMHSKPFIQTNHSQQVALNTLGHTGELHCSWLQNTPNDNEWMSRLCICCLQTCRIGAKPLSVYSMKLIADATPPGLLQQRPVQSEHSGGGRGAQ